MDIEKEVQPILLENLEIRLPGFAVQRLGLNQHMPRVEKFGVHSHAHWQALLYLRGQGSQHFSQRKIPVQRGSLLVIPPGERHRFVKEKHLRPVCLVLDFESEDLPDWQLSSTMAASDLKQIERLLGSVHELHRKPVEPSLRLASYLLKTLAIIQDTARPDLREMSGPITGKMERLLQSPATDPGSLTPSGAAKHFGISLDHLNRMLHSEGSPPVGKFIAAARLKICSRLLKESNKPVGEIGFLVGYPDQNYFARWFRRQTGQTPTQWRNSQKVTV